MDQAKRELIRAWLIKARNDLTTAREVGSLPAGPLDTAIYHCQQAAEKAVKGFLAFHDHPLERTHDVERLVEVAQRFEPRFGGLEEAAIVLTPYATAFRYPSDPTVLEPTRDEFQEALTYATNIVDFVRSLLPADLLP